MLPGDLKRLKQLEEENGKRKKLAADLSLDKIMPRDLLSRKQQQLNDIQPGRRFCRRHGK